MQAKEELMNQSFINDSEEEEAKEPKPKPKKADMFSKEQMIYLYRNFISMEQLTKERNEYTLLDYQRVFQQTYDFVI